MIKKIILAVLAVVVVLICVVGYRTFTNSPDPKVTENITVADIDVLAAAQTLSESVQIKTISTKRGDPPAAAAFARLHDLIDQSFPLVTQQLKKEVISDHSLLYTWQGSDQSLPPVLLMAHMDVVPVEAGTEADWTHEAYSGAIADGAIWGRGTLDDKVSVFGILEAAETLLATGFSPKRTLYFGFGHDEEIGGENGAAKIAQLFAERDIKLSFTVDEGMVVVQGVFPGIDDPIAFIALAEKGYLTVTLTAETTGGHSSIPPKTTAIGKIARAVNRLEENRFPAALQSPASDMFDALAPYMPLSLKAVVSNRWLFDPILLSELEKGGATNAMIRTTTAATIIDGGSKDNILPTIAAATLNFRLLPGTTIEEAVDRIKHVIDDPDVTVEVAQGNNPSRISSKQGEGYVAIEKTIREVLPDVLVAPGLMLAGSDSKHYEDVAENSYRFIPMRFGPDDIARVHGTDERIMIENYGEIIRFYHRLMQNVGG